MGTMCTILTKFSVKKMTKNVKLSKIKRKGKGTPPSSPSFIKVGSVDSLGTFLVKYAFELLYRFCLLLRDNLSCLYTSCSSFDVSGRFELLSKTFSSKYSDIISIKVGKLQALGNFYLGVAYFYFYLFIFFLLFQYTFIYVFFLFFFRFFFCIL